MKNSWALTFLVLSILTLGACAKKDHSVAPNRATSNNRVSTQQGTSPNIGVDVRLSGQVVAVLDEATFWQNPDFRQESFMNSVLDLISATDNPDAYGYVSGDPRSTHSTGIKLGGRIPVSQGELEISKSFIEVEIRDQYAGTKAPNGEVIPAYTLRMPMDDYGYYPDDQQPYELIFKDAFGVLYLDGFYDAHDDSFKGALSYRNFVRFDGTSPTSGERKLGEFKIPYCDLFKGDSGCN